MKYTIDDLRGKYVKVGTPECDEFLKACVKLDVRWCNGSFADIVPERVDCIAVSILFDDDNPTLGHSCEKYWVRNGFVPFASKTDTMTVGEMVDNGYSVFGGRITTDEIDNTVTQRGERYGLFADGAVIMQDLKTVMRATPGWERLTPSQREALEMIQHKIGRVLNGDPMYVENFTDIAGYAILVKDEMLRTDGATDAKVTYVERTNGSWVELNKRTS